MTYATNKGGRRQNYYKSSGPRPIPVNPMDDVPEDVKAAITEKKRLHAEGKQHKASADTNQQSEAQPSMADNLTTNVGNAASGLLQLQPASQTEMNTSPSSKQPEMPNMADSTTKLADHSAQDQQSFKGVTPYRRPGAVVNRKWDITAQPVQSESIEKPHSNVLQDRKGANKPVRPDGAAGQAHKGKAFGGKDFAQQQQSQRNYPAKHQQRKNFTPNQQAPKNNAVNHRPRRNKPAHQQQQRFSGPGQQQSSQKPHGTHQQPHKHMASKGDSMKQQQFQSYQTKRRSNWPTKAEAAMYSEQYHEGQDPEDPFATASNHDDPDAPNFTWDPMYATKQLADFDGTWAPPPVDWEKRPDYVNYDADTLLNEWRKKVGPHPVIKISKTQFLDYDNTDIAPHAWFPERYGGATPDAQFKNILRIAHATAPEEEAADWTRSPDEQPWWNLYKSPTSPFLRKLEHPDAPLDPTDECFELAQQDKGSIVKFVTHGTDHEPWDEEVISQGKSPKEVVLQLDAKSCNESAMAFFPPARPVFNPRANFYLRAAEPRDMHQIATIYNWHVENSVQCAEHVCLQVDQIRERLTHVGASNLPVLVAVDRVATHKVQISNRTQSTEKVLAYAYAEWYHSPQGMFNSTVQVHTFVDKDYYRRGIGSCVFDKLLGLLDPWHGTATGYESRFPNKIYRAINTMLCSVPYEKVDDARVKWISKFLEKQGFKQKGDFPDMGVKHGKIINLAIFHLRTLTEMELGLPRAM